MTSLESYLDQSCARLSVNPAEAEDIREELSTHLQELIAEHVAAGLDRRAATARALAQVGDARSLRESFSRVHTGDPWWVWRLRGLVLGGVIGGTISLLLPLGGHLEFVTRPFGASVAGGPLALNGLLAGALIGVLSTRRGFFIGWFAGSLIWMAEYVAYFIVSVATNTAPPDGGLHLFNSVLLSPVLGGLFGALVGGLCTTLLTAASRLRPEIR